MKRILIDCLVILLIVALVQTVGAASAYIWSPFTVYSPSTGDAVLDVQDEGVKVDALLFPIKSKEIDIPFGFVRLIPTDTHLCIQTRSETHCVRMAPDNGIVFPK